MTYCMHCTLQHVYFCQVGDICRWGEPSKGGIRLYDATILDYDRQTLGLSTWNALSKLNDLNIAGGVFERWTVKRWGKTRVWNDNDATKRWKIKLKRKNLLYNPSKSLLMKVDSLLVLAPCMKYQP